VHSNDPEAVVAAAESLGIIEKTDIQDMVEGMIKSREQTAGPAHAAVRIAADSAISLGRELQASLGIARIEHRINIGDRVVQDADINLLDLMRAMKEGRQVTTAQVSPEDARAFFDETLETSDHIVFIAVGDAYTGTQNTVRRIRDDHPEKERITIVDSRAASGQQGVACVAAAKHAAECDDVDAVAEYATQQVAGCREYLLIDDLIYLKRSGRIGKIKAAFASFLSIKPIVGHSGEGAMTWAKVKSHDAAVEWITGKVLDHPGQGELLVLVEHTDNLEFAKRIQQHLKERLPDTAEVLLAPLSSASAVHMGPGTWGVSVTRK
jgi:DegV family protein with EDD domain